MYKRFIGWLIISFIFLILFIKILGFGSPINTNVLDLLPKGQQDHITNQSINRFSKNIDDKVVFLISNPSKSLAMQAADSFYHHIASTKLFSKIGYKIDDQQQLAWGNFYYPYRMSLLTSAEQKLLLDNNTKKIVNNAIFKLYSPSGIAVASLLDKDPYFLYTTFLTSIPKPASNVGLIQQRMMVHTNNQWYVLINAELKGNSFAITNQNKVMSAIKASKTSVLKSFPHSKIAMTGMLFYAKSGTDNARHDISTIGIGSLLGIILLMLLTFRSLLPLMFTLLSSAIGFICAFVATRLIFGSVDLFTLVFGASLIGISVDYAFFYYSDQLLGGKQWCAKRGLKNIISGISLGLLNVVIAYLVLLFTPFPGLKQLAVFAVVGLIMAYGTVVCAFPLILKAKKRVTTPPLLKATNKYLSLWESLSTKKIAILYIVIIAISIAGIYQLKPNDNINMLESVNPVLKHEETNIKKIIGNNTGMSFFVVRGKSPDKVLTNETQLTKKLTAAFPTSSHPYTAINSYIPSIENQKLNYQLIQKKLIDNNLLSYLTKIGMTKSKADKIKQQLESSKFKPLTVNDWKQSKVSKNLRFLWLGKVSDQYASIVLLSAKLNTNTLKSISINTPSVTYVNKASEISSIFKDYRQKISYLLGLAYLALLILLIVRYSFKKAMLYFLPPLTASLLALAALGLLHIPLTLFNVLGLFLVLGIAVDYVLFFAETKSSYQSTMLAVSLSAITTILSFGLLSLSTTPVIHNFGITVLVGIASAFILSPLVTRIKKGKSYHEK